MNKELIYKRMNDIFAQYIRICECTSEKEQKKREEVVNSCSHLFALYQPSKYDGACHSSDCSVEGPIIECVYCGLTNKFIHYEKQLESSGMIIKIPPEWKILGFYDHLKYFGTRVYPFENQLFKKFEKRRNLNQIKILGIENANTFQLSQEKYAIKSEHLGLLYKIATQLNAEGTEEEILEMMRSLFDFETSLEKLKLENPEDASELISRYQDSIKLSRRKEV